MACLQYRMDRLNVRNPSNPSRMFFEELLGHQSINPFLELWRGRGKLVPVGVSLGN